MRIPCISVVLTFDEPDVAHGKADRQTEEIFLDDAGSIASLAELHRDIDDAELIDWSTDDGCWEDYEFDGFDEDGYDINGKDKDGNSRPVEPPLPEEEEVVELPANPYVATLTDAQIVALCEQLFGNLNEVQAPLMIAAFRANITPLQGIDLANLRDGNGDLVTLEGDNPISAAVREAKVYRDFQVLYAELTEAFGEGGGNVPQFLENNQFMFDMIEDFIENTNSINVMGIFTANYNQAKVLQDEVFDEHYDQIPILQKAVQDAVDGGNNGEIFNAVLELRAALINFTDELVETFIEEGGLAEQFTEMGRPLLEDSEAWVETLLADLYNIDPTLFPHGLFDENGFDEDGFEQDGYNAQGFNREGYNEDGFNEEGFNKDGFDVNGYDVNGFDAEGFDINGFDVNGFPKTNDEESDDDDDNEDGDDDDNDEDEHGNGHGNEDNEDEDEDDDDDDDEQVELTPPEPN